MRLRNSAYKINNRRSHQNNTYVYVTCAAVRTLLNLVTRTVPIAFVLSAHLFASHLGDVSAMTSHLRVLVVAALVAQLASLLLVPLRLLLNLAAQRRLALVQLQILMVTS